MPLLLPAEWRIIFTCKLHHEGERNFIAVAISQFTKNWMGATLPENHQRNWIVSLLAWLRHTCINVQNACMDLAWLVGGGDDQITSSRIHWTSPSNPHGIFRVSSFSASSSSPKSDSNGCLLTFYVYNSPQNACDDTYVVEKYVLSLLTHDLHQPRRLLVSLLTRHMITYKISVLLTFVLETFMRCILYTAIELMG